MQYKGPEAHNVTFLLQYARHCSNVVLLLYTENMETMTGLFLHH